LSIGKRVRLERLINRETGKTVLVPMDHGVSSGPMEGIVNLKETVQKIAEVELTQ
jgi:2-amino-3,7-dideoxy-D-threo-hept-6-ulosonate synthase